MSAKVASPGSTLGGYQDSIDFNWREEWALPGLIPLATTISGPARLVCNVALAIFNTLKAVIYTISGIGQWMFSKETGDFAKAADSLNGIKINVAACAFAVFESIPIVGNLPYWGAVAAFVLGIKLCEKFYELITNPPKNSQATS